MGRLCCNWVLRESSSGRVWVRLVKCGERGVRNFLFYLFYLVLVFSRLFRYHSTFQIKFFLTLLYSQCGCRGGEALSGGVLFVMLCCSVLCGGLDCGGIVVLCAPL